MKIKTFFFYSSSKDYSPLDNKVNEFISTLDKEPIDIKANYFNGALIYTVVY